MKRHWNYRIIRHRSKAEGTWYGLHEVHYKNGKILMWAPEARVVSDTRLGIVNVIAMMLEAATGEKDVLDEKDMPGGKKRRSTSRRQP